MKIGDEVRVLNVDVEGAPADTIGITGTITGQHGSVWAVEFADDYWMYAESELEFVSPKPVESKNTQVDLSKWRILQEGEVIETGDCFLMKPSNVMTQQYNVGHEFEDTEYADTYRPIKAASTQVDGDHYSKLAIQPIEYIEANNLGYSEGNAIKYITRHKDKGGKKDIEKAIHYLTMILERQYT